MPPGRGAGPTRRSGPRDATAVFSGLVKAVDLMTKIVTGPLRQGETAVSITQTRANLVLELFDAYYKRVYCFARKSLGVAEAEDIAQEVFSRLLTVKRLEELTLSSSYLIKIADNLIKRRYNKNQRRNRYIDEQRDEAISTLRRHRSPSEVPGSDFDMDSALAGLPTHEADAVRLVVCEGLSYEEASASMGVPVSTINNWKYRGVQKLKARADESGTLRHSA